MTSSPIYSTAKFGSSSVESSETKVSMTCTRRGVVPSTYGARCSVVLGRAHPLGWGSIAPSTLIDKPHRKCVLRRERGRIGKQSHGNARHASPSQLQDYQRQQAMLHLEHACRERVRRVPGTHRHGPLGDDRPVVVFLVHVVNRRPRDRGAAREHPLVHAAPVPAGAADGAQRGEQVRSAARERDGEATRGGRHRGQGLSDLGFVPTLTLSENGPVANLSVLVTTIV